MSALKKSELVTDSLNQTEYATVNGNSHIIGTIGEGAEQRAEKQSKVNWRLAFSVITVFGVIIAVFPNIASAQATAPTAATFDQIYGVIDPVTMSYAIATLGGAALVAAFSVGGGFKIGKKAYAWIMGKL